MGVHGAVGGGTPTGVSIDEIPTGPARIEGVGTSTLGMVGRTRRGPEDGARLVTSWEDFEQTFGGHLPLAETYFTHAVAGFFLNGGRRLFVARAAEAEGTATGLAALGQIDEIALLAVPDHPHRFDSDSEAVTAAIVGQCERRRDRFAILATRPDRREPSDVVANLPTTSSYAALYYPYLRVFDPASNSAGIVTPVGHVAGIYARCDVQRGVHAAPANEEVLGLSTSGTSPGDGPTEFAVSAGQQEILNPRGVNVIRDFRAEGRGVRVWGARTLAVGGDYQYVNVRRTLVFIEQSIGRGTRWAVFEDNAEPTWQRVVSSVASFLRSLWRDGALAGVKEEDAFFVRCDRTTMTQEDIDDGRLICLVGVAPLKPAEFVIVRICQLTRAAGAAAGRQAGS